MRKIDNAVRGACGEHFVASYLSGLGLVVALTKGGSPTTDIIVTSELAGRSISLQVKTGGSSSRETYKRKPENNCWIWRAGTRAISAASESHWYAFVYAGDWPASDNLPEIFFVPSSVVVKRLSEQRESQRDWFWMYDADAQEYRGVKGYEKLAKCLVA